MPVDVGLIEDEIPKIDPQVPFSTARVHPFGSLEAYRCISVAWLRISGGLQCVGVMQQLLLDSRIGGHTEGGLPLRSNEAAGALEDPAPKRVQAFEDPEGRAFLQRRA
jgi:hypothetical protein